MRRKGIAIVITFLAIFTSLNSDLAQEATPPAQVLDASKPEPVEAAFTNADVVKLTSLGMGSDVIIAKVSTAKQVAFKVEIDDLVALKNAGVGQDVITAMVKRSSSPIVVQGTGAAGGMVDTPFGAVAVPGMDDFLVRLVTQGGTTDLTSIAGHAGTTWAFFTMLMYMDYPNLKAEVRIRDRRPYVLVQSRKSPQGRIFLVHCESNKGHNDRSVKMGKSGMYSSSGFGAPDSDSDWTVPIEVKAVQPGLWRMDPKSDLKPGEYGVWGPGSELYDFAVDK